MARLKILIVEDDRDYSDVVADALIEYGHEVAVARDGASAIAIAREWSPDAVLLDLRLPDMLGYEIARTMRRRAMLANAATIIVVTGDASAQLDRADAVGVDVLLHKPIDASALVELVEFVRLRRERSVQTAVSAASR